MQFPPGKQTGELGIACLHKTLENIISHLFSILSHTLSTANLKGSYKRIAERLQGGSSPDGRLPPGIEDPNQPHSPAALLRVKPIWLAALGGGRVVESQRGKNTFIKHSVLGELQHFTVTQLYTVAN